MGRRLHPVKWSHWLAVVAFSFTQGNSAQAWEPAFADKAAWCAAPTYAMNEMGESVLGVEQSRLLVSEALAAWTGPQCTVLSVQLSESTNALPGVFDEQNVIGWIEEDWPWDEQAIGVTLFPAAENGCIVETDIQLNGVTYEWADGQSPVYVDPFSILLHEVGHALGLGHSADTGATMFAAYAPGTELQLATDDVNGICALYPAEGVDCTVTGCPAFEECVEGRCRIPVGDGTVCAPCDNAGECGGANDFCILYPDNRTYCGRACEDEEDCLQGDACVPLNNGLNNCIRVRDDEITCASRADACRFDTDCDQDQRCDSTNTCVVRSESGKALGEVCVIASECNTIACHTVGEDKRCVQSCDWLNPGSCPDGFYCSSTLTGSCSTGLCIPGSAGQGAFGEACDEDQDCASLFCSDGLCSEPCLPDAIGACEPSQFCERGLLNGCGACKGLVPLGAPCEMGAECETGVCLHETSGSFCSQECDGDEACADTQTCDNAGATKLCTTPPTSPATPSQTGVDGGNDSGSGCAAHGAPREPSLVWLLCAFGTLFRGRRRVGPRSTSC